MSRRAAGCTPSSAASSRSLAPIQEGASRALKPLARPRRLVRRHAGRQGTSATAAQGERDGWSARSPSCRSTAATPTSCASSRRSTRPASSADHDPVHARVIARNPSVWYSTLTDQQRLLRRRAPEQPGGQRRGPGRPRDAGVRRHRRRAAAHRQGLRRDGRDGALGRAGDRRLRGRRARRPALRMVGSASRVQKGEIIVTAGTRTGGCARSSRATSRSGG